MTAAEKVLAPIKIIRPEDTIERVKELSSRMTLDEQIESFEMATNAKLTRAQRHRIYAAQPYKGGDLAALHEAGTLALAPEGPRLLLRAILQEDASVLSMAGELAGHAVEYDARTAITHEIVAIGTGVEKHLDAKGIPDDTRQRRSIVRRFSSWLLARGAHRGARPMVGDHVFVLSTVADRVSKTSRSVRLWSCHCDDVSLRWPAPT